jgi:hypothetical protein
VRRSLLALFLISLPTTTFAQVLPGDLLLNSFANPDVLVHYRVDGTVVQTSGPGTGDGWEGAGILPDGNWVTTRRNPSGVNIFDGITGAEIATWNAPFTAVAGDVGVFSDGSIAIVEQNGNIWRFDIAGNVLATWVVPSSPFGILVDDEDTVWTCDGIGGVLWHTDDQGNKLGAFPTGGAPGDVTMAADGTLFVTRSDTGEVAHFAKDGTLLGSFTATTKGWTNGIAMGEDQTLWVTAEQETKLLNFDQSGAPLGSFDVGPAMRPLFLTIPVTEGEDIGKNYCGPANLNSTGQPAEIAAFGSTLASKNYVALTASRLPRNVFAYFLNSETQGFTALPPGSSGNLCLGGGIGRHVKQVGNSGAAGEFVIDVDLSALPRPGGTHSVVAGETWNFQCWFRDDQGGPTSNFTDGIEIVFQ